VGRWNGRVAVRLDAWGAVSNRIATLRWIQIEVAGVRINVAIGNSLMLRQCAMSRLAAKQFRP